MGAGVAVAGGGWIVSSGLGWQVGNTNSQDFKSARGLGKDHFTIKNWTAPRRKRYASDMVASLIAEGGGHVVVGDASWVHTQYMAELLEADTRVVLVYQYREDLDAWYQSVAKHKPQGGRSEGFMLQSCGIFSLEAFFCLALGLSLVCGVGWRLSAARVGPCVCGPRWPRAC